MKTAKVYAVSALTLVIFLLLCPLRSEDIHVVPMDPAFTYQEESPVHFESAASAISRAPAIQPSFAPDLPPHGGSAENTLLIINPSLKESVYIGNYYKNARKIPDQNVIYMDPYAANYNEFVANNLDALFGMLKNRGIEDHIDYMVIAMVKPNSTQYRVPDSGYTTSGCSESANISISAVYSDAFSVEDIKKGVSVTIRNNYAETSLGTIYAFDSSTYWYNGQPTDTAGAFRRFFMGALLGYVGTYANTVDEITAMIDRSVAVDGTRPSGTFYFMSTTDSARNVRSGQFPAVVNAFTAAGGNAVIISGVLPTGHYDALGIMTGVASPGIVTADMTMLPGSFGDHLTSYAGVLSGTGQEEMSNWITKGGSGTAGTVEEPCNYTGKFPHACLHYYYWKGLSLGEAYLRSLYYVPFQNLFYGDPLTRPFAHIPTVTVSMPSGPVSGTITISPTAVTAAPQAAISHHYLYIDGMVRDVILDGGQCTVNTMDLSDGIHDIRVVSYDNTSIAVPGRWIGQMTINNYNRQIQATVSPSSGNLSTLFTVNAVAQGGTVYEIRLKQNGRVIASGNSASLTWTVSGAVLGGGRVSLLAEAEYTDFVHALSAPQIITVANNTETVANPATPPVAFSYTTYIRNDASVLVELPGCDPDENLTYAIVSGPTQGSIKTYASSMPVCLLRPNAGASGSDTIRFSVTSTGGTSQGTITVRYYTGTEDTYSIQTNVMPSNSGVITLSSPGPYNPGETVTLTAVPNTGRNFIEWQGDITGNSNPVALTMNSNKSVTAVFSEIINRPPIASAGPDTLVTDTDLNGSQAVTLDGSRSSDPDGDPLSYTWRKGASIISDKMIDTVTLLAGVHFITLTVRDIQGAENTDTVTITVNKMPVAQAGDDQVFIDTDENGSEPVTLNGSTSSDPDGSITRYRWQDGATVLSDGTQSTIERTLTTGVHTMTLTVWDNSGDALAFDTDEVRITINTPDNQAPAANAGIDRSQQDINGDGYEDMALDGSGSSDPDGSIVSYRWYLNSLEIGRGIHISYRFPVGDHTVELVVQDDKGLTGNDTVRITILAKDNELPVARIKAEPATGTFPLTVTLDGSDSSDPDGTIVNYFWDLGNGLSVVGKTIHYTYTIPGTYTVTLTVQDDKRAESSAETMITVREKDDYDIKDIVTETSLECLNNIIKDGSTVTIQVYLEKEEEVGLWIYDSKGKEIKLLHKGRKEPGSHQYAWDGTDESGKKVGSGIYMVHLEAGNYKETKKIAVVK